MSILSKILNFFNKKPITGVDKILRYLREHPDQQFLGTTVEPHTYQTAPHFTPLSHSLWAGTDLMSKKDTGLNHLTLHLLSHPEDLVVIIDPLMNLRFTELQPFHRVIAFTGDYDLAVAALDWLYLEIVARRQLQKPHQNIIVVIENQNYLNFQLQLDAYNGSTTWAKLKTLMNAGPRQGVFFSGVYETIKPEQDLPTELLKMYPQVLGFRMSKSEADRIGTNSHLLPFDYHNCCYNQKGEFVILLDLGSANLNHLIQKELKSKRTANKVPDWLVTANPKKLQLWKQDPKDILNHYQDPALQEYLSIPIEDLAFWDFINLGPEKK